VSDTPVRSGGWPAWDVLCVLVFVVIGRRTHDHAVSWGGVVRTAWPFLAGLAVGWLALARRRPAGTLASGALVAASTVAVGMALRVVAGQGTAAAFIVVATAFLGLTMVGARAAVTAAARRRA
jgi:Protein of unknown function (DUF3054)